jgi:hypothetical protein
MLVGAWDLELLYAADAEGTGSAPSVANRAREALNERPSDSAQQRYEVATACANLAATFLDVKAYPESFEFGRRSIELATYHEHVFLRLAAAL